MASHRPQRPASPVCAYWMQGRGCRDLQSGACRKRHPDTYQGRDMISMNLCHRFARGRCGDAEWCKRLRARTLSEGRRELDRLGQRRGGSGTLDPFVQACVDAVHFYRPADRDAFAAALLSTIESAEPFQTPPLRVFFREKMAQLQDVLRQEHQPANANNSEWQANEAANFYDHDLNLVWQCWEHSARHSALGKQALCPSCRAPAVAWVP